MKRILYIQYTNPGGYPPLEHSSRILAEAGWSILFLGTGAAGANELEFPANRNIRVRRMSFCPAGWRQKLHYMTFCFWVLVTVLSWRPACVYASDPLSCVIASLLTWIPGLRVVYHEHDSPPGSNDRERQSFSLISGARQYLVRRAGMCVLPNSRRLVQFERELGPLQSSACVWNCPSRAEVNRKVRSTTSNRNLIVYHGSLGPDLLPESVVKALALLPKSVLLRVTGYETIGSVGYTAHLSRLAESYKVRKRIEFRNAVPRWQLLESTGEADIGLAMMPMIPPNSNYQGMAGASNKAFDYMACGLALVVSDLPEWREMFVEPGYALACNPDDPQSIAAALLWLVEHPNEMRTMGESARSKILSDWNYENMFRPVVDYLSPITCSDSAARRAARSI